MYYFLGMMAGAYIWGSLADALGRRKVLIVISFMKFPVYRTQVHYIQF